MDGAGRLRQMWSITLPTIRPTITILLILAVGSIINSDYMKIMVMYNPRIYEVADVIGTYMVRNGMGLGGGAGGRGQINYSYGTAIGLLNSVTSVALVVMTNKLAKTVGETSLW